jgi:Anti-sigma-K factor rskA, C-terminal
VTRKPPDLRELIGNDVPPDELARLGKVHDLLVRAGPPPELPSELVAAPSQAATVALLPNRRWRTLAALAAALALAAFGVGWLAAAARDSGGEAFPKIEFQVPMQGTAAAPHAVASIAVGEMDKAGNWPMAMTVRGLPRLAAGEHYELWLTKKGKLIESCGTFRTTGDSTVYLNAPFKLRGKGWAVTRAGSERLLLRTERI